MSKNDRILIASAKGGVGKSTTAVGLALAFLKMGKSVLLVDCDASSRSLDLLVGEESEALYDLGDIILDRVSPKEAVSHPIDAYPNFSFCTAPHAFQEDEAVAKTNRHLDELAGQAVAHLIEEVPADIVLIDTSSGGGAVCAKGLTDLLTTVLITSEQSKTSVRAAEYTASQMEKIGLSNLRLIVCSFDVRAAMKGERSGVIEMIDQSTLKCAGVVPYDKRLILRQDKGLLPDEKCVSQTAYRNIANRLCGMNVPLFEGMRKWERRRGKVL